MHCWTPLGLRRWIRSSWFNVWGKFYTGKIGRSSLNIYTVRVDTTRVLPGKNLAAFSVATVMARSEEHALGLLDRAFNEKEPLFLNTEDGSYEPRDVDGVYYDSKYASVVETGSQATNPEKPGVLAFEAVVVSSDAEARSMLGDQVDEADPKGEFDDTL
jgi:hypothetical protein